MLVKPEFREQARLGLRTEETRHVADVARHHSLQVASEMRLAADPGLAAGKALIPRPAAAGETWLGFLEYLEDGSY
jgi:hypothetical protein